MSNTLKEVREAKGLTLQKLAELAGINTSTVWLIEQKRVKPKIATQSALSIALGVSIDTVFGDTK